MKSIKRLLAAILCVSLALGCVLVQAEETASESAYGTDVLGLINALGIADYEVLNLSETLSRGEFYEMLCKTLAYPETKDNTVVFSDLKPGEQYEGYAKTLYKLGYVSPLRDGKVRAGDNISKNEAVSLIVKGLGYSPKAEAFGGYPVGYLTVAGELKIISDIDGSAEFTKGMAVEILGNALECDLMVESVSADGTKREHKVEKDTNLLNTVFGLEITEGIVDGVDISRVYGKNDVKPFHMEIEGKELNSEDVENPTSYLGYYVKVYHKEVRTYGDKIIYIEKTDDNEEINLDIEDVKNVYDTKVEVYVNEGKKVKDYRINKGISLIYNGVSTKEAFTYKLISGKNGSVKLVDNTGDGVFDIVFVDVYENYIVSHVDLPNRTIYNKYDNTDKMCVNYMSDDPYVLAYDETGAEINPASVKSGDMISVYRSMPDAYQAFVRMYVSKREVTGIIESIEDEDEITIDGVVYKVTAECLARHAELIKVGSAIKAILDIRGYIGEIAILEDTDYTYGFLVAAGTESGLGGKTRFVLYNGEEELVDVYGASNIRIDGIRYKNGDNTMLENLRLAAKHMFPLNSEEDFMCSVVRYMLNSEGNVSSIDTIMYDDKTVAVRESAHNASNCLFGMKLENTLFRRLGTHLILGEKNPVSTATMVMGYPDVESNRGIAFETSEYNLHKMTDIYSDGSSIDGWVFYTDANQVISTFLAAKTTGSSASAIESHMMFSVVDRITTALDKKYGTEIECLNVYANNKITKIPVKSGFTFSADNFPVDGTEYDVSNLPLSFLKQGDIIRYTVDGNGYLKAVSLHYRPTTNDVGTTLGFFGSNSNTFSWIAGYVYKSFPEGFYIYAATDENGKIVNDKEALKNITMEDCFFVHHKAYSNTSYSCDFSEELEDFRVTSTSPDDFKSYCDTGDDCSFVVVQRYDAAPFVLIEYLGLE